MWKMEKWLKKQTCWITLSSLKTNRIRNSKQIERVSGTLKFKKNYGIISQTKRVIYILFKIDTLKLIKSNNKLLNYKKDKNKLFKNKELLKFKML